MRSVAGVIVSVLAVLLVACGGNPDGQGPGTAEQGWSFSDGVGPEIKLDAPPKRIVARLDVAAGLADMGLGDLVVGVYYSVDQPPESRASSPNLDLTKFKNLTPGAWGVINVEEMVTLNPDLVIDMWYGGTTYFGIDEQVAKQIQSVVPIAAIKMGEDLMSLQIESAERLATALGAPEADLAKDRDEFAQASERLKKVSQDAGNPKILFIGVSPDGLNVYDPEIFPQDLGLNIIGEAQRLSWEEADFYPDVDIAWLNTWDRDEAVGLLNKSELWMRTPAGQNDAYIVGVELAPSAAGYARYVTSLADELEAVTRK